MTRIRNAILVVLCMMMTAFPAVSYGKTTALPFSDIHSDDWYFDPVQYVYEHRIMTGISSDEFAPDQAVSRAMMVTVLYRMSGEPASSRAPFTDVSPGAWYADAVGWAAEHNIVNGISETIFAPDNDITREQMAAILYRYADFAGYDTAVTLSLSEYEDASMLHTWSSAAVRWACAAQILHGTGEHLLEPESSASRAQMAAILQRLEQSADHNSAFPQLTTEKRYRAAFDALASGAAGSGGMLSVTNNTTIQQGAGEDELLITFVLDETVMTGESKELLLRLRRDLYREVSYETRIRISLDREYEFSSSGTIDRRSLMLWDDVDDGPSDVVYNDAALQSEDLIGVYYVDQYTQILLNVMMGDIDDYLTFETKYNISDLGMADDETLKKNGPVSLSLFFK